MLLEHSTQILFNDICNTLLSWLIKNTTKSLIFLSGNTLFFVSWLLKKVEHNLFEILVNHHNINISTADGSLLKRERKLRTCWFNNNIIFAQWWVSQNCYCLFLSERGHRCIKLLHELSCMQNCKNYFNKGLPFFSSPTSWVQYTVPQSSYSQLIEISDRQSANGLLLWILYMR